MKKQKIKIPSKNTIKALKEMQSGQGKSFKNIKSLFSDLEN